MATLEFLACVASLGGKLHLDDTKRPRFMRGPLFQIIVREHPSIGLVAQIQDPQGRRRPDPYAPDRVRQALAVGCGLFTYKQATLVRLRESSIAPTAMNFSGHLKTLESAIDTHFRGCSHQSCYLRNQAVSSWRGFHSMTGGHDLRILWMLLFGDEPSPLILAPTKLLSTRATLQHILTRLGCDWYADVLIYTTFQDALQSTGCIQVFEANEATGSIEMSSRWASLTESHVRVAKTPFTWVEKLNKKFHDGTDEPCSWFDDDRTPPVSILHEDLTLDPARTFIGSRMIGGNYSLVPGNGDLLVHSASVTASIAFAEDTDKRLLMGDDERRWRQRWFAWQLQVIDCWLKHHGGHSALCAALNLITRFVGSKQNLLQDVETSSDYTQALIRYENLRRETTVKPDDVSESSATAETGLELKHIPRRQASERGHYKSSITRKTSRERVRPSKPPNDGPSDDSRKRLSGARWTKISRTLVNPEALELAKENFEEKGDYCLVLRMVTKDEVAVLVEKTREIRGKSWGSMSWHIVIS